MLRDFPIRMKFLFFTGRPAFALSSLDRLALCGNSRRLFLPLAGVAFHPSGISGAISKWSGESTEPAINSTAYAKGTLAVYWMTNFLGMSADGLVCENVAMAMGIQVSTPCSASSFL